MNINEVRQKVKDPGGEFWTDKELQEFSEANDQNENAVIAECMEDLAANPDKGRRWGGAVKYTHYDFTTMAEYQRQL